MPPPKKQPVKSAAKKTTVKKAPVKKAAKPKDSLLEFRAFMAGDKAMELLTLVDDDLLSNVKGYVSTQSLALNKAIGHPGVPLGRVTEISGDEHTGKSTVLDHILAEVQRVGGIAILLDPEVGRDAKYTRSIGVDPERLVCPQPKGDLLWTTEKVFSFVGKTADFFRVNDPERPVVLGVDSVAGLPTEEDLKRDAGELKPGDAAKVIHHGMRTVIQRVAKASLAVVLVNQLYENIGAFGFGDRKKEYGGKGVPYHASLRVRLNRVGAIKTSKDEVVGSVSQAFIKKSKVSGSTGSKVQFGILHGRGVDNTWSLFNALKAEGYITNSGAWWRMRLPDGEELKWTGQHWGLAEKLAEDEQLYLNLVQVYEACVMA